MRLLLDELNHRTQNTLAIVQSIVRQTLRNVADKDVVAVLEDRIMALSKVHVLLGRENWQAVSLRAVIDQVLEPFGLTDGADRFPIEGEEVRLAPKAALTLALVFQELATNAAKYGALSTPGGKVSLTWTLEPSGGDQRMRLTWRENGGPLVERSSRKGFGARLIEGGLAKDLQGEVHLDYARSGLVCRIEAPIAGTGGRVSVG